MTPFRASLLVFVLMVASGSADERSLFIIPGEDTRADSLNRLFERHYNDPILKGAATLWDQWLVGSTIWRATSPRDSGDAMRVHWRRTLLSRRIDADGYVSTHQHAGAAHIEGWPFPFWSQAGGIGYHFSLINIPYLAQNGHSPLKSTDGWTFENCSVKSLDEQTGLTLTLDKPNASVETPLFHVDPFVAPFAGLEWSAEGLSLTDACFLEWSIGSGGRRLETRRTYFTPIAATDGTKFTMIPLHRHLMPAGELQRFRICFQNTGPATATIKSLFTSVDSRHNVNNTSLLLGAIDYIRWTRDLNLLREMLPRLRRILGYSLIEFDVHSSGVVYTRWVGHDGRPGFKRDADGKKTMLKGHGIGSNYWDLLPFGSRDTLATIYLYAALKRMAELEELIGRHPEWNMPSGPERFEPFDLNQLADRVQETAQRLFWNEETGRFVPCIDEDGVHHDYGYTFVNLEAIHYGLASPSQAKSIFAWIDGQRTVDGDTSQGGDIYHFRFAPRATTRRNIDWYMFAWIDPESIPFGGQVQDGGAVMGFSYHDVMARLKTLGPENAWNRLGAIADWYREVEAEGGYRKYYSVAGRGTLQGGGTAGGLGLDQEFVESVMVPSAMIDGFAGLDPTLEGLHLHPRLPASRPKVALHGIAVHQQVIDLEIERNRVHLRRRSGESGTLNIFPPAGNWKVTMKGPAGAIEAKHYVPLLSERSPLPWNVDSFAELTLEMMADK